MPDGTEQYIPYEDTDEYLNNLGWFDALAKADSKHPLMLYIHSKWQNRLGRRFEQVMKYQIDVTRSGSAFSISFVPDKILFKNY